MKRKALALTLALALSISAVAGTTLFNLTTANPINFADFANLRYLHTPVHPKTTILSPKNNTLLTANSLTIRFNVSISSSYTIGTTIINGSSYLIDVVCQPSWQDAIGAYEYNPYQGDHHLSEFSYELNLTGIPEGNQTVMIRARGGGGYEDGLIYNFDDAYSWDYLSFTVVRVSVLSPQNKTYDMSDVPLLFDTHETLTQIWYSLDGKDEIMVSRNTTLTGLSNGHHNVTFYAMDAAGKTVALETAAFTIAKPEPFPTTLVIAVSGVSMTSVSVVLLVYFKKRKRYHE